MTLGDLIKALKAAPQNLVVRYEFGEPMSYRGYYDHVAFKPEENVTVASMLKHAESAVGATFTGYKGGKFRKFKMGNHTETWIAEYGQDEQESQKIGPLLLKYMLGDTMEKQSSGGSRDEIGV